MMDGLKKHWSHPKFDGLPWAIDRKKRRPAERAGSGCVKKVYSQQDAQREAASLQKECPQFNWRYKFCEPCQGFHVLRSKN